MKTDFKKNLGAGWLYFYIHFITEVACFFVLSRVFGSSIFMWITPFIYDALAFGPQSLFGRLSDKFPKIPLGVIGGVLLALGVAGCAVPIFPGKYTSLVILCLGNACTHINGAEVTLRCSGGKLSHSAIFVGGGSILLRPFFENSHLIAKASFVESPNANASSNSSFSSSHSP